MLKLQLSSAQLNSVCLMATVDEVWSSVYIPWHSIPFDVPQICELHMIYDESYGIVFNLKFTQNISCTCLSIHGQSTGIIPYYLFVVEYSFWSQGFVWKSKIKKQLGCLKIQINHSNVCDNFHENETSFQRNKLSRKYRNPMNVDWFNNLLNKMKPNTQSIHVDSFGNLHAD